MAWVVDCSTFLLKVIHFTCFDFLVVYSLDSDNIPKMFVSENGLYLGAGRDDRVHLLPYNCRTKHHLMWTCDNGAMRNGNGQYLEFGGTPAFCTETHRYSQQGGEKCCGELEPYNKTHVLHNECKNDRSLIDCPSNNCMTYRSMFFLIMIHVIVNFFYT